jgi:hypothetical protein
VNPLDQGRRKPKLTAKLGLTFSHLAVIRLMIETTEMKQAMQQQDANLVAQVVSIGSSLTRRSLKRDSEIARMRLADLLGSWKAKHVGRLVLASENPVQPLKSRIVSEQDVNFALKPHATTGAVEEARQTSL